VLAVVTKDGLGFAKQAAARHSSNTTAESITYLSFKMASDSRREKIGVVIKQGQHPGKFSSAWPQGFMLAVLGSGWFNMQRWVLRCHAGFLQCLPCQHSMHRQCHGSVLTCAGVTCPAGLMMLAGIQGMLAEPCAALLQDSQAMQVGRHETGNMHCD